MISLEDLNLIFYIWVPNMFLSFCFENAYMQLIILPRKSDF